MKTLKLFFLLLISASFNLAQDNSNLRLTSVVIMPFDDLQEYPYNLDQVYQSLLIGFTQKGFNVVVQDSVWEIILDRDLRLTNLTTYDIEKISNDINVDLIVFGRADNYSTFRQSGFYSSKMVNKPILIRVFDTKKKEIILFERLTLNSSWGLFNQNITFENFGSTIAQQIKNMGY